MLDGYAVAAADLIPRYESFSSPALFAPVIDLIPKSVTRVVDIGAGTGRDAAWLASLGHEVTAVEPVSPLRDAGECLHRAVHWLDDSLPALPSLRGHEAFGLVVVNGVWQHLTRNDRDAAALRLAEITAPGGLAILSLRHGVAPPDRPAFPIDTGDTVAAFDQAGFDLVRSRQTDSIQDANRDMGVTWTWLALRRRGKKGYL